MESVLFSKRKFKVCVTIFCLFSSQTLKSGIVYNYRMTQSSQAILQSLNTHMCLVATLFSSVGFCRCITEIFFKKIAVFFYLHGTVSKIYF
jgi:hypothetical protein